MTSPRLLSNRYELGEVLGYGGMSEVHKGRDVRLGRDVAVKVLRADLARDPQFQERFRREAQNAAALNHPAIVAVYDTGETRTEHGPLPYIVMEYVDGRTLRDIVKTEGPLPGQRAMEIMADVSAALDFSHRHGIVHRDVKPANVMITKTGAVKVMDFGIARAVADGQAAVTQTAAVIGTAQYLSPEQARGEAVDARSDVYASGCVLFELLTGEPPFTGDSPVAVAYQHVREDPKPPSALNPRVSPALDAIVLKAMSKGAPNRYQSAAEMRTDLVRVLSNQRPLAPMVMTDEDRTTIMSQGRGADQTRGRHRPQTLAKQYDDYDPYEDDEEERRRRRKKGWLIALFAVLGIAVIGLIIWLLSGAFETEAPSNEYTVPNLVGQTAADAQRKVAEEGIQVVQKLTPCQPAPDGSPGPCSSEDIGKVIDTTPAAGQKMKKSERITLMIGAPAEPVNVPDVTGQTQEAATKLLTEKGLTVAPEVKTEPTDDENLVGKVIDQSPTAGQPVERGSQVVLTIGEEQETVSLPDLTGQDVETAKRNLENFGFEVQVEEVSSDQPPGTVVGQDPPGGEVEPGITVTLQVSNGDQQQEDKITMPSLTGLTPDEARTRMEQLGWEGELNVQSGGETDDPTQFGKIVDQEVGEGQQIEKDQVVGVLVATQLETGGG